MPAATAVAALVANPGHAMLALSPKYQELCQRLPGQQRRGDPEYFAFAHWIYPNRAMSARTRQAKTITSQAVLSFMTIDQPFVLILSV